MSEPTAPSSAVRRWWDRLRVGSTAEVEVTSFGYLHGPAPDAHLTVDLRAHYRDPHTALRELTAHHGAVRQVVLATPGIPELIDGVAEVVRAYAAAPGATVIRVAIGCAGGRHRDVDRTTERHAGWECVPRLA